MVAPVAPGRVLPTLNEDGTRRWLRPKPSPGAWLTRRTVIAWLLMILYIAIPHVYLSGKPSMLLDLQRREFTFFGATFLPTDTLLLMLLSISFVIAIFLVGQKSQLFSTTFSVRVNFANAEGVKPGSIVVMSGYGVGAVSDIELSENADSVRVTLRINESIHRFIKSDSRAEIKQEGLVGSKLINIMRGSESLPAIKENTFIQGIPPFALGALADNVTAITDSTKLLAAKP